MPVITYEALNGTTRIRRDEYHADNDPFVTAFDRGDNGVVENKTKLPIERVVRIDE